MTTPLMLESGKPIWVDKKIKPIRFELRKQAPLEVGYKYYVSFGSYIAEPCILIEIHKTWENVIRVTVETRKGKNTLYANEIGLTPKEAVVNEVSR